jgi:Polyketide cyclase / dehydrase and lipid transport
MRALVRSRVDVNAPADVVWGYVTDWPRQGEWIPFTRVETVGPADGIGGRIRAWTGVGPVGFWDPMTITAWSVSDDGSARCEVLHRGAVVRGEAEFSVTPLDSGSCRFEWWEHLTIPGGFLGSLAWRVGGRLVQRTVRKSLQNMAIRCETAGLGYRP